jgi:peroxiredoxin-like protein
MATQLHEYPITVEWNGGRDGTGVVTAGNSGEQTQIAVPPEFMGPGGATNPEELLTSAITGCYSITFGIVATNRKLPVVRVVTSATGVVEQNGANFVYRQITLRPTITVDKSATDEQIKQVIDMAVKADHYCIVTNAVRDKVQVAIEPEIEKGE